MPGFSFTAPIITIEEEEQERRELSPAELARLEEDLFGPPETLPSLVTPLTDENTDGHNVVQDDVDPSDDEEDAKVGATGTTTSSIMDAVGAVLQEPESSSCASRTAGDTSSLTRAVEDLVHQVQETILQMTPLEQRDYMEALERVPHLIQTESNPILMLHCEENNVPVRASY
jgi:hypothetical protein